MNSSLFNTRNPSSFELDAANSDSAYNYQPLYPNDKYAYDLDDNNSEGIDYQNQDNCTDFLDDLIQYHTTHQIVVPVVYCVISLIGLLGNGLVIFVIVGSKEVTKSVANIYILNLAIADTMLLLVLPFNSAQRALFAWPFGVGMCKIVETAKYLSKFATIFFLAAMSVDRYFAVVHVVAASRYRTNRMTFLVCFMVWILSFVMTIPLLIYSKVHGDLCILAFSPTEDPSTEDIQIYEEDYSMYISPCDVLYSPDLVTFPPLRTGYGGSGDYNYDVLSEELRNADNGELMCKHPDTPGFLRFLWVSFAVGFVLPIAIICISYAKIVAKLLQPSESRSRSRQADRTRRKVTRMVIALSVAFFVCWCPFYVWHIVMIKGVDMSWAVCTAVRDLTFCLGFMNSCLNPLLYTFLGQNFQDRLRRSISMSLRPFTFSTFSRYTSNTLSRADTGFQTRKMDATNTEPAVDGAPRTTQTQSQVPEEEQPCIKADANANHEIKK